MLFKSAGSGAFFRALATALRRGARALKNAGGCRQIAAYAAISAACAAAPPEGGGLQPPTRRDNLIGADRRRSLRAAENRKIDAKERIDIIA